MESFVPRGEDVLLGHSPHRQHGNSPKSTNGDLELDFSDVFGGPPRRFSMQETRMRHNFCEPMESDQDSVLVEKRWSGFDEKPVFGSENVSRRSYHNDDFFGDIFRRDDSRSHSSPRMSRDVFGSSPGSRILSPARPLPPKAEPFSTSVPAQFSFPAKLKKATDFPVFESANRSLYRSKDGIANWGSHSPTSNVSLSRFSSQTMELPEETRKDQSLYRQSPLSHKISLSSEQLTYETKSVEKDEEEMLRNNSQIADASKNSFQFHFSIYKWAGKGVPLLMSVLESNKLRSKYRSKMERCSSSNGRIHCDSTYRDSSEVEDKGRAVDTEEVSPKVERKKHDETSNEIKMKSKNTVKGTHSEMSESENLRSSGHLTPNDEAISERKTDEKSHSKHEVDLCEKTEKEAYTKGEQALKHVQKPLSALFSDEKQEQGSAFDGVENEVKISTAANGDSKVSSSRKKTNSERSNANKAEGSNAALQGSARVSGNAFGKSAVKGKVREFVKIFNQETSAKPRTNSEVPNQSSGWKDIHMNGTQNEIRNATNTEKKVHESNTKEMPDASCKWDHSLKADKQHPHSKSSVHGRNALFSDLLSHNHKAKVENRDESFQGHFLVEELTLGLEKDLQTGGDSENIKGLDAKIQQWSNGRKGNIRSLLSTLQLVLWPGCGWKPVPLVDIIEGNAVKRAYQKALLCLHPDKLQQKGAASHQKYIAARVFDILQEAWDHFNSLGAI